MSAPGKRLEQHHTTADLEKPACNLELEIKALKIGVNIFVFM